MSSVSPIPRVWYHRLYPTSDWVAPPRTALLGAGIGKYSPTTATAGIRKSEAQLTAYNSSASDTVVIPNNAVVSDKIVYGDVTYLGDADMFGCLFVGGSQKITSGNVGVLNCTNTRTGIARHYDCTIRPRMESDGRDCVLGKQFELHRCHMAGGVDGFGIYNTSAPYVVDVKIRGCLIENMAFVYPDRDHSNGSHNDGGQIQGGGNIEIVGNAFWGTAHWMAGSSLFYPANPSSMEGDWPLTKAPGITSGAGLIVDSNAAPLSNVLIDQNYFYYGKAQLLLKSGAGGNVVTVTGNRFSSVYAPASNVSGTVVGGTTLTFTYNPYWIRLDNLPATNVIGLTSGGAVNNTTNVWLDGALAGQALIAPRGSGIASDV